MAIIDNILEFFYDLLSWAILLLPESPIQSAVIDLSSGPFGNILNYINYFVPIGMMSSFFALYLTAVITWYIVRWALRIVRYVD